MAGGSPWEAGGLVGRMLTCWCAWGGRLACGASNQAGAVSSSRLALG